MASKCLIKAVTVARLIAEVVEQTKLPGTMGVFMCGDAESVLVRFSTFKRCEPQACDGDISIVGSFLGKQVFRTHDSTSTLQTCFLFGRKGTDFG